MDLFSYIYQLYYTPDKSFSIIESTVSYNLNAFLYLFRPADFNPFWATDAQIQRFFGTLRKKKVNVYQQNEIKKKEGKHN